MAKLWKSHCALRIMGDDLDPDEITQLLGKVPTKAERKGDRTDYPSGRSKIARGGMWRIIAAGREPGDLDAQVAEILAGTTEDLSVWRALSRRFEVQLFVGLFLEVGNEGLYVSRETTALLGARSIAVDFDIYDGCDD